MTTPQPPDAVLDSVAMVEAISADDVEGLAALLRYARLTDCAQVLDNLLAADLVAAPLWQAFAVLRDVGKSLAREPSTGNAVITLARELGCRWCDECVADGSFRRWALGQRRGG
jgi:hypothetical protein